MHVNLWLWSLYVNQWNLVFICLLTLAIHEITVHKTCMTEEICLFTMIWEYGVLKCTRRLDCMHTDCSSVHQQYNRYLQFFLLIQYYRYVYFILCQLFALYFFILQAQVICGWYCCTQFTQLVVIWSGTFDWTPDSTC